MKNRSRLFRVVGAAALLISMLAATVAPAAAQQTEPFDYDDYVGSLFTTAPRSFVAGGNTIYYPWVANGEDFGLGPSQTSISVQNLEDRDGQIWIFRGDGNNTWTLATTAFLSAYASKQFTAAQLGIAAGDGAPVAVVGYNVFATAATTAQIETLVILSNPITADDDGGETTQVLACVVNIHANENFGAPYGYTAAVGHIYAGDGNFYNAGDWVSAADNVNYATWQESLQETLNLANAGDPPLLINPFGGLNADGDCLDSIGVIGGAGVGFDSLVIGGVAVQTATAAAPGNGDDDDDADLEQFVTTHTAVSGYNSINGSEVFYFDEWYLPIVQTNCGPGGCWDSMLRVANLGNLNSAVTIRFFPADDGSGSLQTGFQLQALVNGGDTWHVNLGDYVPDGWVGTAHILSDGAVFAMVDRYKVGYNMWITNTGSAANYENLAQYSSDAAGGRYALFAPHVLMDYFGWNTGINVANLANAENNVSIQYFNMLGNATQVLNQRLAAHGMTYFYDPSVAAQNNSAQDVTTDPNAGVVGSAIIWSDFPVAAAVDATKYPETDPRGGPDLFQATSYNATQNVFTWQAVPYVTKGNPTDGSGATSGINIMNPNSTAVTANVYWVNPSGFNAQNFGVAGVTIPGYANGFVYTLWQHNLPNGFTGAAQVIASQPVAAVSANVNYDVEGDGSAIFNAFNPCGYYRTVGACFFGDPLDVTGGSVTKYFVDPAGDPVPGVIMQISGNNPAFPYTRQGVSNVDGQVTFTNVPVGQYDLNVITVPAGYVAPENPADQFTLIEGDDVVLTNVLGWDQGFLKTVCLGDFALVNDVGNAALQQIDFFGDCVGEDDDDVIGVAGINVVVFENIGEDFLGGQVAGDIVFEGVTGPNGSVGAALAPGDYILCIYQEDGVGTIPGPDGIGGTPDDIEVNLLIQDQVYATALCAGQLFSELEWELWGDLFTVEVGEVTELFNAVYITEGDLNVFVGISNDVVLDQAGAEELNPLAGVEVCLNAEYWDGYNATYEWELVGCGTTNDDGQVTFYGVADSTLVDFGLFGVLGNGYYDYYTGSYQLDVYSNDFCVYDAWATGWSYAYQNEAGDNCVAPASASLAQTTGQDFAGSVYLWYNATGDVVQDDVMDDQNSGTHDVLIEMEVAPEEED